MNGQLKMM